MKIAILYICTGKYDIFWDGFHQSSEQCFLTEHEKHYFVFTESTSIKEDHSRIHKIHQNSLGWPYNTLMRFKFFLSIENELKKFDYIYFFNSNMRFLATVGEEVFPTNEEDGLLAVLHPGYFNKTQEDFPYERNKRSMAYIKKEEGKHYYMGGFNGGKAKDYLNLIKELNHNIKTDLSKNIIALWHDESHLNAYLLHKNNRILSPAYGFGEGMSLPFESKIIILDKIKFGGHHFLREIPKEETRLKGKLIDVIKKTINRVIPLK